jgi:hypothetical protein
VERGVGSGVMPSAQVVTARERKTVADVAICRIAKETHLGSFTNLGIVSFDLNFAIEAVRRPLRWSAKAL